MRGFTRQVLVVVIAHIKTIKFRRIELLNAVLPPKNLRASTTDDVECFFNVTRDLVGKNLTVKQLKVCRRKICFEFRKRLNPDLTHNYFTSSHDRLYEGK